MKKYFPLFLALVLSAFILAACGADPSPRETIALGVHQELVFRPKPNTSEFSEVKVVFTTIISETNLYSQVFLDGKLISGINEVSEIEYVVLPGLVMRANGSIQQIEIYYDPNLWEVKP